MQVQDSLSQTADAGQNSKDFINFKTIPNKFKLAGVADRRKTTKSETVFVASPHSISSTYSVVS